MTNSNLDSVSGSRQFRGAMLDCENRLNAARYFLDRARQTGLGGQPYVWCIQAAVIFAISAVDILMYDYAERKTGKPVKEEKFTLEDFKRIFGFCFESQFYDWLNEQLNQNKLYIFLRTERHKIVHRGEPPKKHELEIIQPLGSGQAKMRHRVFFEGWETQTVEEACQSLVEWVASLVGKAKREFAELAEEASRVSEAI